MRAKYHLLFLKEYLSHLILIQVIFSVGILYKPKYDFTSDSQVKFYLCYFITRINISLMKMKMKVITSPFRVSFEANTGFILVLDYSLMNYYKLLILISFDY